MCEYPKKQVCLGILLCNFTFFIFFLTLKISYRCPDKQMIRVVQHCANLTGGRRKVVLHVIKAASLLRDDIKCRRLLNRRISIITIERKFYFEVTVRVLVLHQK